MFKFQKITWLSSLYQSIAHCWHMFIITFRKYSRFYACQIMFFCYIYLQHLKGRSLKLMSDIKLFCSAKKVWGRWFRPHSPPETGLTSLATVCQCRWLSHWSIRSWCRNLHLSGTSSASLTNSPTAAKSNINFQFLHNEQLCLSILTPI